MLTELDVVNACLATIGQGPLTDLTRPHRLTSSAKAALKTWNRRSQLVGWWFNIIKVEVTPDPTTKRVDDQLPPNTIEVTGPMNLALTLKAPGVLYDHETGESHPDTVELMVKYEVPFDDLPPSAQEHIQALAVYGFAKDFDADAQRLENIKADVGSTYRLMNSEHIRAMKVNLLSRTTTGASLFRSRGTRPVIRYRG